MSSAVINLEEELSHCDKSISEGYIDNTPFESVITPSPTIIPPSSSVVAVGKVYELPAVTVQLIVLPDKANPVPNVKFPVLLLIDVSAGIVGLFVILLQSTESAVPPPVAERTPLFITNPDPTFIPPNVELDATGRE